LLTTFLGLCLVTQVWSDDSAELWLGATLKLAKCDRWTLVIEPELRFQDNVSQLSNYNAGIIGLYKLSDTSTFGLGYRYLNQRSRSTPYEPENRWLFQIGNQAPLWSKKLTLKVRQRLELRRRPGSSWANNLRTRHRIGVSYTLPRPWLCIHELFSQNELFVDWKEGRIVQNRWFPIGIKHNYSKRTSIKLAYLNRRRRSGGQWSTAHAAYLWFDHQFYDED